MKNVGLVGCGHIAETYFRSQKYFNNINFVACADIDNNKAENTSQKYKIDHISVNSLLNDERIDIVLNLTVPKAHFDISKKALKANKHVYCEKPMSIKFEDANQLLNLAKEKNLYLGNAPDTFLGGGGQLSKKIIDNKSIGDILTGNFIFAFPGVQDFHPNAESWFQEGGGPVIDMGPYFFTTLVNLLGPAKNVRSRGKKFSSRRQYKAGPKKGNSFDVTIPTSYMLDIEFENGAIIQGFLSFDVMNHKRNHIELYGTKGSIIVPDPNMFGGPIFISHELGSIWEEISVEDKILGKTNIVNHSGRSNEAAQQANYRGIGLAEMIDSIENKREHLCNSELALHVLDIIDSILLSSISKSEVNLRTTCKKPPPLDDNLILKLIRK